MQISEDRIGEALVLAPAGRVDSVTSAELERVVVSRIEAGDRPAPGNSLVQLVMGPPVGTKIQRRRLSATSPVVEQVGGRGIPPAVNLAGGHVEGVSERLHVSTAHVTAEQVPSEAPRKSAARATSFRANLAPISGLDATPRGRMMPVTAPASTAAAIPVESRPRTYIERDRKGTVRRTSRRWAKPPSFNGAEW